MITMTEAESALAAVRELVAADGGDIMVSATSDDGVALRLVLDAAECAECVMPRAFLETVALDMMKTDLPALARVEIDDPRE